ncbi:MAG: hypothetical protein KC560_20145, partial [Myxococcales bacterium]|nr:hypothetical protein [Myxococcales bacterium]
MDPRERRFALAVLCVVALLVEGMSYATGRVLERRGVLYRPAALADYAGYLAARDPVLGWPPPGDPSLGADGARPEPGDGAAPPCGAAYGDSFTYGAAVGPADTWPARLSAHLGCRVANFGVSGYGSDQALLRFRGRATGGERFAVLAHLTENAMRNVNQFRGLLYAGSPFGFKPRFEVGQTGGLSLVPLPAIPVARYGEFVAAPERFLDHEYFAPGGPSGLAKLEPPYSIAILRAFRHFHVRAALRSEPWYLAFYDRDHPSNALRVTTAILRAFAEEAEARGVAGVPAILPTELDLEYFAASGRWTHRPLVDALAAEGVDVLDVAPAFAERLGSRPAGELFAGAHPTAEANEWIAEIVARELERRGLAIRLQAALRSREDGRALTRPAAGHSGRPV